MAKYLLLWESDNSRMPVDPGARAAGWSLLVNMVKQDMESGFCKDWGVFPAEGRGYLIAEGSETDILIAAQRYVPYITFKIHPVASLGDVEEQLKTMLGE